MGCNATKLAASQNAEKRAQQEGPLFDADEESNKDKNMAINPSESRVHVFPFFPFSHPLLACPHRPERSLHRNYRAATALTATEVVCPEYDRIRQDKEEVREHPSSQPRPSTLFLVSARSIKTPRGGRRAGGQKGGRQPASQTNRGSTAGRLASKQAG